MSTRLIRRAQARHPGLRVRDCVRASSNPSWLAIAAFVGYSTVSFVLRVIGVSFEQSLALAFPAFVLTYLSIVRRFYVVGTDTDIYLLRARRKGYLPSADECRVGIEEIEIIEESMVVDRWYLGERELAIRKRHRRRLAGMVTHIAAELSAAAPRG